MNRDEAIEKVIQMVKLADSTTHEGEDDAARRQITRLRLQHGISDADLERAQAVDDVESSGGLGGLFAGSFFYNDKIRGVHVAAIRNEIEAALAKIARQDLKLQLKCLAALYDDLRGLVESGAKKESYNFPSIQARRNEVIKKLYAQERERIERDRTSRNKWWIHSQAVQAVTFLNELTKAQVEAAVGIHEDDEWWERSMQSMIEQAKKEGCDCKAYFVGKRTKSRVTEGPARGGTSYNPGQLRHQYGCAITTRKRET
jgi:hypothetical protein